MALFTIELTKKPNDAILCKDCRVFFNEKSQFLIASYVEHPFKILTKHFEGQKKIPFLTHNDKYIKPKLDIPNVLSCPTQS